MLTAAQPADYDHCCFKDPNLALTFTNTDDMGYLYFSSTTHRKIRSVQRGLILQKVLFQFHQSGCRLWGPLLPCSSRAAHSCTLPGLSSRCAGRYYRAIDDKVDANGHGTHCAGSAVGSLPSSGPSPTGGHAAPAPQRHLFCSIC